MERNDAFLIDLMKENLNQARHAENERMMFVTLFAALMGGTLAVISQFDNEVLSIILVLMMIVINFICIVLTRRWNDVFRVHWDAAQRICCYLAVPSAENVDELSSFELIEGYEDRCREINQLFCFDNRQNVPAEKKYVRTANLFLLFNLCTFVLLLTVLFHLISRYLYV